MSGWWCLRPRRGREHRLEVSGSCWPAPRVNRYQKVDHDAAEWLPSQSRCWFATRVIAVRQRYGLTIDRREADALDQVLAGCESTALVTFARGAVPVAAAAATGSPEAVATWDDDGNGRVSCAEARAHGIAPVTRGHPAYPFMRDGDGDGVVCESGGRASPVAPSAGPAGAQSGCGPYRNLYGAQARPSQRRFPRPLRVSAAHGPGQRRAGGRTVGDGLAAPGNVLPMRKKLIEVALPLDAINTASSREKSIRHGHPSTLHLWWARRPLAAARAVIFSQMVDDPSEYVDVLLSDPAAKRAAQRALKKRLAGREPAAGVSSAAGRAQAGMGEMPAGRAAGGPSGPADRQALGDMAAELERERLFRLGLGEQWNRKYGRRLDLGPPE